MTIHARKWNGKPIGMPGLYADVAMESYHGNLCTEPSLSGGGLKKIVLQSPAHYFDTCPYNPDPGPEKDTEAMKLGRAAHHVILGEKAFKSLYAIRPEVRPGSRTVKWHGTATECIEWMAARKNEGREVLSPDQGQRVLGMARALAQRPLVQQGILNGLIETSLVWKDKETGVWLKARPDALPLASLDFSDLKTTASVEWEKLLIAYRNGAHYISAALTAEGCRQVLKMEMSSFTLVFVESKRPHSVRELTIKDVDIARGARLVRAGIRTFADCLDSGRWPGPGGERADAEYIELPSWHQARLDEHITDLEA